MTARKRDAAARDYYSQQYDVIIDYGFVTKATTSSLHTSRDKHGWRG